jgi:hypothetical protein
MDILITAGNIRMLTFEIVCRAVQAYWPDGVGFVHVFDTQESFDLAEEKKRDLLLREIFGPQLEIRSSLVDEDNLQTQIPNKMSQILETFSIDQILVDLTNGQKFVISVLYATASISRIKRIYSLLPKVDFSKLDHSQLKNLQAGEDYEYIRLEPLLDIQNVARSSFLELVYYRDEIEAVVRALEKQDRDFADDARRVLMHGLSDYFSAAGDQNVDTATEKYTTCVASLGKLCEELAERLYAYFHEVGKARELPRPGFNAYVREIGKTLEKVRNIRPPKSLDQVEERLKRIVIADGLLDMTKMYRNLSSHPKRLLYSSDRYDAKLNLDATLLFLRRLSETDVLAQTGRKS